MKKSILFISVLLVVCSCSNSILYRQPLPAGSANEKSFPPELRGIYYYNDEAIVSKVGEISMTYRMDNDSMNGSLSDSLILRKYHNDYLLNVRVKLPDTVGFFWRVYLISVIPANKMITLRYIPENLKEDTLAWDKLVHILKPEQVSKKPYVLEPTDQQLGLLFDRMMMNDMHFWKLENGSYLLSNQKLIHGNK